MIPSTKKLEAQRILLVAECALQRATLATQIQHAKTVLGWKSGANHILHRLKTLPVWAGILVAGCVIFMPKRALVFTQTSIKKILLLWQIVTYIPRISI